MDHSATQIHAELLFCNHNGTINLNVKKHLDRENSVRLDGGQLRLTTILDELQSSIDRYEEYLRVAKIGYTRAPTDRMEPKKRKPKN